MIDWAKLEPYEHDKYRSFEELCYQIAIGLFGGYRHCDGRRRMYPSGFTTLSENMLLASTDLLR